MRLVIIGLGYVGLPLAREAARAGIKVTGLDTSNVVVTDLNSGSSHVDDISSDDLKEMLDLGFEATTEPSCISRASFVVVCVPTPLADNGGPDLTAVEASMRTVSQNMQPGTVVILESTTYPGTTEEIVKPILDKSGLELERDYFLAFSPERIDPGNKLYGAKNTPKVVGGATIVSGKKAAEMYLKFVDQVKLVSGTREAEMAKLLENTYRHINIALMNEMAKFCHDLGIDLWKAIDAAKTKPFGFQAFYPGPGVGGHCIPIDPNYLSYNVKERLGYPFQFVELAQSVNGSMPAYVLSRIQDQLNEQSKPLRGSNVLLIGVTYKANIADQRESPAVPLADTLRQKGAVVTFHDPFVEEWKLDGVVLRGETSLVSALTSCDLAVLLQAHDSYDLEQLASSDALFLDTRGALPRADNIERL